MAVRGPVIRVDHGRPDTRALPPRSPYPPPIQVPETGFTPIEVDNGIVTRPVQRDQRTRTLVLGGVGQIVPIDYGQDQLVGPVPWAVSLGNFLYMQVLVGEGPLEAIEDLRFGDSAETTFARLGLVSGTNYNLYLGTPSQGVDPIFSGIDSAWVQAFPGTAWVSLKLPAALLDTVDVKTFRCTVKGRQVVDPRIDPTMVYSSRAYSDNPALCLLDFLLSKRFGLGATLNEVNLSSFIESADDCDVIIASGVAAPVAAPTDTANTGSGTVEAGIFRHAFTNVDTNGVESQLSPEATEVTVISGLSQHITVSSVTVVGAGIIRRIYRQKKNPDGVTWGAWKHCVVPEDDSSTTFNDFLPTSVLGGSPPDESDIRQFRLAAKIDQPGETCGQTIDTMRQCFMSQLIFNNGRFQSVVDKVRTPTTIVFDESNIHGIPTVRGRDPAQIPSQIIVNITDVLNGYAPRAITWPPAPIVTDEDVQPDRNVITFDLPWIPSFDQGTRTAIWIFNKLTKALDLEWTSGHTGALGVPGSVVGLQHARAGIPLTDVILTSCGPQPDRVYWTQTAEIYDVADYNTDYHSGTDDSHHTHEPPPIPDPPTNLDLECVPIDDGGTPSVRIDISWDEAVMPYETSTVILWSIDNFVSDSHNLGTFSEGVAVLFNTEIGTRYWFRLYSLRVANGQLSELSLDGDIIATFLDPSIPEATQLRFRWPAASLAANKLDWAGPLGLQARDEVLPPAPTVSVSAGFGSGCDLGDHEVAVSIVYPWGEGHMGARSAPATITGSPQKIDVSGIAPGPYTDGLVCKIYMTLANDNGGTLYWVGDEGLVGGAGGGNQINQLDSVFNIPNDAQPTGMNGFRAWEVFCANTSVHGSDMPIFDTRTKHMPATRYAPVDCTSHVHEDPSDHQPRIDVMVRVVDMQGGISTGVMASKHPAAWGAAGPPISIPASVLVVDGVNEDLDIPADANFVYIDDGGITADFSIGGITVQGATPTTRKRITFISRVPGFFRAAFDHESSGSTAANRLALPYTDPYDIGPIDGSGTIEYDTDASRWKVIASNAVGFGSTGGGGAYVNNSHVNVQIAGFRINETGIAGNFGTMTGDFPLAPGNNDDIFVAGGGAYGIIHLIDGGSLAGSPTIRSIINHGNLEGSELLLWNDCGFSVILEYNWAGAASGAKIFSSTGANETISVGPYATARLTHPDPLGAWLIETIR